MERSMEKRFHLSTQHQERCGMRRNVVATEKPSTVGKRFGESVFLNEKNAR